MNSTIYSNFLFILPNVNNRNTTLFYIPNSRLQHVFSQFSKTVIFQLHYRIIQHNLLFRNNNKKFHFGETGFGTFSNIPKSLDLCCLEIWRKLYQEFFSSEKLLWNHLLNILYFNKILGTKHLMDFPSFKNTYVYYLYLKSSIF